MRSVNDVALDHHVFVDKVSRIGVVCHNTAHLRRRQIDLIDPLFGEKGVHGGRIQQVQLITGAQDQLNVVALLQLAHNG